MGLVYWSVPGCLAGRVLTPSRCLSAFSASVFSTQKEVAVITEVSSDLGT